MGKKSKKLIQLTIVLLVTLFIFSLFIQNNSHSLIDENFSQNFAVDLIARDCQDYQRKCNQLFKKLRFPNQSLVIDQHHPPPRMPPSHLLNRFTQNGDMPITKEWYFNEVYTSSNEIQIITSVKFNRLLDKVKSNKPLHYNNIELQIMMNKYKDYIKDKNLVVLGTRRPWIEAIAYYLDASQITTLEYNRKKYEVDGLEWFHVNDYLDSLLDNSREIEQFANAVSFSSIEHSGLGRYGDPLSPEGDIDAVRQVHCFLKPNGLFWLGLPTSKDDSSYIVFNSHRVYGSKRLKLLFRGWHVMDQVKCDSSSHSIYLLQKKSVC